jgi:hypothetical protein
MIFSRNYVVIAYCAALREPTQERLPSQTTSCMEGYSGGKSLLTCAEENPTGCVVITSVLLSGTLC